MPDFLSWIGLTRARFVPGMLVATLCLGPPAVRALTPDTPVLPVVVHGTAVSANGKPLAGATLYLLDLPGSQYLPGLGDKATVVTDAQGRFAWTVPKEVAWNFSTDVPKESAAPACYALPLGDGWRATVALAANWQGANADIGRRDLLEKATRRCETHWIQTGKDPQISVVAPDTGQVTLIVRGPNGRALAKQAVEIVAPGTFSDYEGAVVYDGETDSAGRLQMRRYSGLLRLLVTVPGVGFGATGTFELLPDGQAAPALPPLAPFAQVSGSLAPTLRKPGAFVHVDDYMPDEHRWYDPQAVVDAGGHFTLNGVLPGQHRLVVVGGRSESGDTEVTVHPGERVTGIAFKPKAAEPARSLPFPLSQSDTGKTTVRGHVFSLSGQPVDGADIYALCSHDEGGRGYQEVLTARTGPDGGYVIAGVPAGPNRAYTSLVAMKPGFPAAVASAKADPADTSGGFHADLVLPDGHSGLTVRVLQAGKPLAGASVHLTPQSGTDLFSRFYFRTIPSSASDSVAACLEPSGTTDANGEVRFRDLAPGLWDVSANLGGTPSFFGNPPSGVSGTAQGIAVTAGTASRFTLSVYLAPQEVAVRVLAPNGQPPAKPEIALQFTEANDPNGGGTSLTLDKDGNGHYSLWQPGLWRMTARFRDTPLDSYPADAEPLYEGSALVAVSPALAPAASVLLRTVHHGPGRIRIRLLDRAGRPAAGTVSAGDGFENAKYALTVNANGEGVFPDLSSGIYHLKAAFSKPSAPPALGNANDPFPPDAAISHIALLVPQTAVVTSDTETLVTFRPQPMGYVRGRLRVSDSPENYGVYPSGYSDMPPAYRYNPKTCEFVVGPFPAGSTMLWIDRITPKGELSTTTGQTFTGQTFPVDIPAGQVVHVAFTPAPQSPVISLRNRPVTGRVFLADGTTPAWGARAALVVPETDSPVQMARTDALGRLNITDYWRSGSRPLPPMPGNPTGPVLVAWLPGTTGAVIVPADGSDARLVLPPPISLSGRVTVGGKSALGMSSSFRILAAYQGRGRLNPLLDVEATAQSDGAFTLAGLTPGTYRVQAARDGLWLSETQTLVVSAGSLLTPLTLDIAPPGAVMLLHLADASGKALPGRTVTLDRPSGPLTDLLWPPMASSDSYGDLRLDGLEAGSHTVEKTSAFTVPPQSLSSPRTTVEQTVILSGSATGKKQGT